MLIRFCGVALQMYASPRNNLTYTADAFGFFTVDTSAVGFLPDFQDLMKQGAIPVVAVEPNAMVTYFGGGLGTFPEEGNLNRQISSAGINPGATGVDSVLAVYSLPASSFDVLGRGLEITAEGSFGPTANNKRVKLIFNPTTAVVGSTVGAGGTVIADTAVVATNGGGWSLSANVFKYGTPGSNNQIGLHAQAQVGAAVAALLAPSLIAAVESGVILIAVTGNATTAASDIIFNFLEVNGMN